MHISINLPLQKKEAGPPQGSQAEPAADLRLRMRVYNLNFYYGSKQALFGINLGIAANRVTGLIGPSGCGKSTLLRALNRMHETISYARLEGDIRLDDENIMGLDVTQLRRRVGMVFQKANPYAPPQLRDVQIGRAHV